MAGRGRLAGAALWVAVLGALVLQATAEGCNPGYTGPDGGPCVPCAAGTFKPGAGSAACFWCGQGGRSAAGSTGEAACACGPGHTGPYRTEAQAFARTTLAGSGESGRVDGVGTLAEFNAPRGVAFSPDATFLAVSCGERTVPGATDLGATGLRLVHAASGNVSTLAGGQAAGFDDGVGTAATFRYPGGVAYSPDGAHIAVADQYNHAVRLVRVATGEVSTLAGTGAAGTVDGAGADGVAGDPSSPQPTFKEPVGVAWSPHGVIAVSEYEGHRVRLITLNGSTTTLAGAARKSHADGVGSYAAFNFPTLLSFSPDGAMLALADRQNFAIRLIRVDSGLTTTLAGSPSLGPNYFKYPCGVSFSPDGSSVIMAEDLGRSIKQVWMNGDVRALVDTAIDNLYGIAWSPRFAAWAAVSHKSHEVYAVTAPGCIRCEVGKYKELVGDGRCTACAEGKYMGSAGSLFPAVANASACLDCAAGKFSNASAATLLDTCQQCLGGKYSTVPGATASSTCKDCTSGKYSNVTGASTALVCLDCPEGKFSGRLGANASGWCEDCVAGKYLALRGSISASNCSACVEGKYSEERGAASNSTCLSCNAGTYSSEYAAGNVSTCKQCGAGTYNNVPGATTCTTCGQGKYVETQGSDAEADCMLCGMNKYSAAVGASKRVTCIDCPRDHYSLQFGAITNRTCQSCPKGALCNDGTCGLRNSTFVCPGGSNVVGSWVVDNETKPVHYVLQSCPAGFELRSLAEALARLPIGQATNSSPAMGPRFDQECHKCPPTSTYILRPDVDVCQPCPVGLTCHGNATLDPVLPGSSWYRQGPIFVLESCPYGYQVSGRGALVYNASKNVSTFSALNATAQQCLPCNVGMECVLEACQVCTGCQPGMNKSRGGTHACEKCPVDTFDMRAPEDQADATPSPSCTQCPEHAHAPSGSTEATDCVCNIGYVGRNGGICTACAAGKYDLRALGGFQSNGSNVSWCSDCLQDTYSLEASSACSLCATNAYSPIASDEPGDCTCNTGFGGRGFSTCDGCSAGKFWKRGTGQGFTPYSCVTCPANADSPVRSPWCTCNIGFATLSNGSAVTLNDNTDDLESSANGMACIACEAGKFSQQGPVKPSGFQTSFCTPCSAGKYSGPGTTVCVDCAEATYNTKPGSSACLSCAADATSPVASSSVFSCECVYGFLPRNTGPKMWQVSRESHPRLTTGLKLFGLNGTFYEFSDALYEQVPTKSNWQKLQGVTRGSPSMRSHHGFAGVGDYLYVHGGCISLRDAINCDPTTYSADFKSYQISTKTWSAVELLGDSEDTDPGARAFHAFVGAEDALYLHGGLCSDGKADVAADVAADGELYMFDLDGKKWTILQTTGDNPGALHGHGLAAVGKRLFLFGGYKLTQSEGLALSHDNLLAFDTDSAVWSIVDVSGTGPSARAGHGFSAIGTTIFVHGGDTHSNGINLVDDMYQFSTDTKVWQKVDASGDPPVSRYFHGFSAIEDVLLVHGGLAQELKWVDAKVVKYGASMYCVEQCFPGTFVSFTSTGSTTCLSCPAGKFSEELGSQACDSCPPGIDSAMASVNCTLCPADTFLDAEKSSDEKTVCSPCPQASQLSLPGSTSVEDCSDDTTDINFQIRFATSTSYFNSASSAFVASIATVLSVNSSRVTLLESTRRTSHSPKARSYGLPERAHDMITFHSPAARYSSLGSRRSADSVICSFVSRLPKASALATGSRRRSDPLSHLSTYLPIQLASDGLPSGVEVLSVSVACGNGREPFEQTCRPCSTSSYKNDTDNGKCRRCPRHSKTSSKGAFYLTECKCLALEGYTGPAGGPCFRNTTLTMQDAKNTAASLTGLIVGAVGLKLVVTIGDVMTASPVSSSGPMAFSSSGTLALITNVQFLSILGRIGGSRASPELIQFSDGLAWINFDVGLFGSAANPPNQTETPELKWAKDGCHWTAVSVPLEIVTTCALTLFCVAALRLIVSFYVTAILEKRLPPLLDFPMWEGLTFVVQFFGYIDAVFKGLKDSCNVWMLFCGGVLLLVPATFAVFALVWIRLNRNDGNISWTHTEKPSFGVLWKRLSISKTCLTKYFSLQIWREERTLKGKWDSDSDHMSFWNFLIQEYCVYEFAIWMMVKRILFSSVLTFLVEDRYAVLNAAIITGTQAVDFVLICILMPWSARSVDWVNIFSGFFTLTSYSFILHMIRTTDEDLLPWWVNDLLVFVLVLAGTAILLLFFLACLLEQLLDSLFKCMDTKGAAKAAAAEIAKESKGDEAENTRVSAAEVEAKATAEEDPTLEKDVSVDFVHSSPSPRSVSSPPDSNNGQKKVPAPEVLSAEDLEAFRGEFPGVTASDPARREEQLRARAEEMAMLRREKELARVARASKRLGWTDKHRGDFGAMGGASSAVGARTTMSAPVHQGPASVPEDDGRSTLSLLTWLNPSPSKAPTQS